MIPERKIDEKSGERHKLLTQLKEFKQKLKDSERECLILDSKLNHAQDQYLEILESKGGEGICGQIT